MQAGQPSERLLHASVLLMWLIVASRTPIEAIRHQSRPSVSMLVGLSSFVLVYFGTYWGPTSRRPRRQIGMLALQTAAALLAVQAGRAGIESALLVVTAGQAPFLVSRRAAMLWVTLQSVALVALAGAPRGFGVGVLRALPFAGFQVFALGAAHLAQRESRARRDLTRVNAELLATQELLMGSTRAAERLRISRDLHDSMGHHLAVLSLSLEVAAHQADGQAAEHVGRARLIAKDLLGSVREVVATLRHEDGVDLGPALATLVSGISRPRIHLTLPQLFGMSSPLHAQTLFRCVQELITNALRHADAENLWITITRTAAGVGIQARDDGRGVATIVPGGGLMGMSERLGEVGGRLELHAAEGGGFEAIVWFPEVAAGAG
jgi:signal transduction histidine kinase